MADCKCGRHAMADSEYCWFCNPAIPDSVKQEARTRGGMQSVKFKPETELDELPPLNSLEGIEAALDVILAGLWPKAASGNTQSARTAIELLSKKTEIFIIRVIEAKLSMITEMKAHADLLEGDTEAGEKWLELTDYADVSKTY